MRNSASHVFDSSPEQTSAPGPLDVFPNRRLVWLFVLAALPLALTAARVAYLQIAVPDRFTREFERTTEEFEPIPTRDGRILSSDGRVLAYDVEQFSVLAHYRWLQEPSDPGWLREQAASRLSRAARRDRGRLAREEQRVLKDRDEMWARLAELSGTSLEGLTTERRQIQQRVERMLARVHETREERRRSAEAPPQTDSSPSTLWDALKRSLTTPPGRIEQAPLVIKEELEYHEIIGGVPLPVAAEIGAHPELYPGLKTRTVTARSYPERSLAAHVIGTRTPIHAEELAERRGRFPQRDPLNFQPGDRIGRSGVERSYDRHLHGLSGLRRIVTNRRGEIIRTETVREPRPGNDVVLALNLPLQERAERLLDEAIGTAESPRRPAGGCIVVLDARTGAVVAAASAPWFDLEQYVHATPEDWERIISDPRQPLFDRAIQMALPPGSTFKVLSAVALLQSGRFDPEEEFVCHGFYGDNPNRNRCYIFTHYGVGHGATRLSDALCRSCNVYFFSAAERIGPHVLVDWAGRFGFGLPTGIDLPGERGGNLPLPPPLQKGGPGGATPNAQERSPAAPPNPPFARGGSRPWYPGDTRGLAIGQSRLTVTPMQIARLMAAVANGGRLVTPFVVRGTGPSVIGETSAPRLARPEPRPIPGLSADTLEMVRRGLERVVSDPQGTGFKSVRLKEIAIAGKTGTAEVGGGRRDHAWFAGYVPADRPRYAFAVVLEHAGSGGAEAGPVARQLVQSMLETDLLQPASADLARSE